MLLAPSLEKIREENGLGNAARVGDAGLENARDDPAPGRAGCGVAVSFAVVRRGEHGSGLLDEEDKGVVDAGVSGGERWEGRGALNRRIHRSQNPNLGGRGENGI